MTVPLFPGNDSVLVKPVISPDNPLDEGESQATLLPRGKRRAQADQAVRARDNLLGKNSQI